MTKFYLNKTFEFKFMPMRNKLFIYNFYILCIIILPQKYYVKNGINSMKLLFTIKEYYLYMISQFKNIYNSFTKFFFFKIKLRGLGYKMRRITRNLLKIFMGYNHFFYMHLPKNLLIKKKGRRLIILSTERSNLNNLFTFLLNIRSKDLYSRFNRFYNKNRIQFLKKRK